MRLTAIATLLCLASTGYAEEQERHPGYPPTMFLASAALEGEQVVVQMYRPGPVPPGVDAQGNVKPIPPGDRNETDWVPLRPVILGKTIQAFGVDGKPLDRQAVLKALASRRGVGVFYRLYNNDPEVPPAFYRSLFREGTLLVVVSSFDLFNPPPVGPVSGAP